MALTTRRESPKERSGFAVLAMTLAIFLLGSCKTLEEDVAAGWQNYAAAMIGLSDSALWPESAQWKMGTESGSARIPKPGSRLSLTLALWEAPTETVWVSLAKADVRYARGVFVYDGSSHLKLVRQEVDSLSASLLRRIHPRTGAAAFDSALAQALVDGDTLVRNAGFPERHPDGVDTASVFRKAMLIMVDKQIPLGAIARNWALGVDTLQIHTRIRSLCEQGAVTDTSKIFPPYPVRMGKALEMDTVLVQGGLSKPVSGSFLARDGIVSLDARILQGGQDLSRLFEMIDSTVPEGRPGVFDLTGKLRIQALSRAVVGAYRLELVAKDDSGRAVTSSVGFRVVAAPDRDGPDIAIVAPVAGIVLAPQEDSIDIEARVVDPSGVDSVWVNGMPAVRSDSSWRLAGWFVPASDSGVWISVRARDKAGNASVASVKVYRKPVIEVPPPKRDVRSVVVSPAQGQFLTFDSAFVRIVWMVADSRAEVAKVWADGIPATRRSDSLWNADVPVPPTGTRHSVRLLAVTGASDTIRDSVPVVRGRDTSAPILRRVAGSRGVAADSLSVFVSWSVADNHKLATVLVGGQAVVGLQGVHGRFVPLVEGPNLVRIEATDSSGNLSTDSVVVVRGAKDTARPVLAKLTGTFDRTVGYDSAAVVLAWSANDPFLATVKIGKVAVVGAQGVFGRLVGLSIGRNVVYAEAEDSTGNVSTDSVVIVRLPRDTLPPVLARWATNRDRTVRFDTARTAVGWSVSDPGLKGVSIANSQVASGVEGFESVIALGVGRNVVRIVAIDSAGNIATDSVVIERLARDSTPPVLSRLPGGIDRKVHYDTATATVGWTVSDTSLKSVTLGTTTVTGKHGTYSTTLELVVGRNVVAISAVDSAGNVATDSVIIVRLEKDLTVPVLVRGPGATDRTLAFGTPTTTVAWRVTDNALRSVVIADQTIASSDSVYVATISVLESTRRVVVVATDSSGNVSRDSILLTKGVDTAPPVLSRVPGTADTTVSAEVSRFAAHWMATDDGVLQSVFINGIEAIADGAVFFYDAPLLRGENRITVVATDGAGHASTDTIVVVRL